MVLSIDVPVSWLKGSRWYAVNVRAAPTPESMRLKGYIINEYTWPALRWEKGDR